MNHICVFTGSSMGKQPLFVDAAREFGRALVARGYGLVYGGASVGLMGVVADTVLEGKGTVIGVIPQSIKDKEVAHPGLTRLEVTSSMHERKARMAELSDAFVAMPGGFGTMEEFFEVLTWSQLGFHDKPCGLLEVGDYFDALLRFLDGGVREGFMKQAHRDGILASRTPCELLDRLEGYQGRYEDKWSS